MINNENLIYLKNMKDIKLGFWIASIIFICGCCLVILSEHIGIGLISGGVAIAVSNIIRMFRLIKDKIKKTEDRIKKLEEEIEFLKNR